MLEETRHCLPQPDSPRYRAMRRQCKRLNGYEHNTDPETNGGFTVFISQDRGGCPCESASECRLIDDILSRLDPQRILDYQAAAFSEHEFSKALKVICRGDG